MEGEKSDESEGSGQQRPGKGSEPRRSLGTRGTEFGQFNEPDASGQQGQSGTGQADLGSQAGSTLSGHADQQELGEIGGEIDQPGSVGGTRGDGFILQQGSGALEGEEEDVEGGQNRGPKSDIEQE